LNYLTIIHDNGLTLSNKWVRVILIGNSNALDSKKSNEAEALDVKNRPKR